MSEQRLGPKRCTDGTPYLKKRALAFQGMQDAGVTVVLSAGNEGQVEDTLKVIGMPHLVGRMFESAFYSSGDATPDGFIVVGGSQTLADGSISAVSFSNPHSAVDVLAPFYNQTVDLLGTSSSGTSFSAPRVAALAANILAINPRLKPADVKKIILTTATPLDDPKGRTRAGVVNENKALEAARESLANES